MPIQVFGSLTCLSLSSHLQIKMHKEKPSHNYSKNQSSQHCIYITKKTTKQPENRYNSRKH